MTGGLVAALLASLVGQVDAREGAPALAVILTPRTASAALGVSELRRALERATEASDALDLRPHDPALESCEARLSCIISALSGPAAPTILFVIATRADGYLVPRAFDFDLAQRIAGSQSGPEADVAIIERALLARVPPERPAGPGRLDAVLTDLVRQAVSAYRVRAPLPPLGGLAVTTGVSGATLEIAGVPTAITSSSAPTQVRGLRPGARDVRVAHPDYLEVQLTPVVEPGALVRVNVTLEPRSAPFPHRLVWPTTALMGLASASIAVGAARAGGLEAACAARACSGGAARLFDGDGRGAGPLAVPLGASLALGGLAYAIVEMVTDGEGAWWMSATLGALVGASTYAVAELAH